MEKRIFQLKNLILFFLFFSNLSLSAQNIDFTRSIKLHIWAELDAYPGLKEAQDTSSGQWDYPVSRIKEVTPFLINGMVYGWNFTYTPYDKLRNVTEYLEITPINTLSEKDGKIIYEKPWIQNNMLNCWASYDRTENLRWIFNKWKSISTQKAHGWGKGKISKGFDGIADASRNALKDAIRKHYRPLEKNKPKEISGRVIINQEPKIGIVEGQYMVELDFFVETVKIVKYTVY